MPNVLMLFEYPTLNGGERSALALVDGIRDAGFQLLVAAPRNGELAERLRASGLELVPFDVHDAEGVRRPREQLRLQLAELLDAHNPDIVHANSLSMSRLSGPVLSKTDIPTIGHLRDIMNLSAGAIADLNCHWRLLAVSQATRNWYVAAGLDAEKTKVMVNGIDLGVFRPTSPTGYLHTELRLSADSMLIGGIGQIGMRKGLDVLLDSAQQVVAKFPRAHFVIVGQRHSTKQEAVDYERKLKNMATTPPLAGHVHFLGTRSDVPQLLNELTLLVHAARQEPLGRVLLEAAAAATPIVATDVGGTREIFPTVESARLVPIDAPQALADVISELLSSSSERDRMGAAARRRVEQSFDSRNAAKTLAQHYQEVLDGV